MWWTFQYEGFFCQPWGSHPVAGAKPLAEGASTTLGTDRQTTITRHYENSKNGRLFSITKLMEAAHTAAPWVRPSVWRRPCGTPMAISPRTVFMGPSSIRQMAWCARAHSPLAPGCETLRRLRDERSGRRHWRGGAKGVRFRQGWAAASVALEDGRLSGP